MNILLKTKVKGNYKTIMKRFDLQLFEALKPKGAKMEIVKFTGSKKGDIVHLRFVSPIKAEWISEIIEDGEDEQQAYFIDEGTTLPFPLRYWQHKHIVQKIDEDSSYIIDDITYEGPNGLLSFLMYPGVYLGFWPRGKVYRKYFGEVE